MSKKWQLKELHEVDFQPMPPLSALEAAKWTVGRSGIGAMADTISTIQKGRPRRLPYSAFLICWLASALTAKENKLCLTTTYRYIQALPKKKLRALGVVGDRVSYAQIWYAHKMVANFLKDERFNHPHPMTPDPETGEAAPCPATCPQVFTHDDWCTRLALGATLPSLLTEALAIDATDLESWAAPQSIDAVPDVEPGQLPQEPKNPVRTKARRDGTWPRKGADGRKQHTLDPDAREGWRTSKRGKKGDVFIGYDLTFGVTIRLSTCSDEYVLPIILCASVRPGGTHKGHSGIDAIDALIRAGHTVSEVVADRGYTFCTHDTWATPLRDRGITQTLDLHKLQRGRKPGPIPGTLWIDGHLYSSAIPEKLIDLPGRPMVHDFDELREWAEPYKPRRAYRYLPLSGPSATGSQRLKGPALAGKVRCVNTPTSLRGTGPTTSCKKGAPCGCGKTVTVAHEVEARERQRHPYGSMSWVRDYNRRQHVESANSSIKKQTGLLEHGALQVMGTIKTAMAVGIAIAAHNLMATRSLRARAEVPAQSYTDADECLPPLNIQRRPRSKKPQGHRRSSQATSPPT